MGSGNRLFKEAFGGQTSWFVGLGGLRW